MTQDLTEVTLAIRPPCDICAAMGKEEPAMYDGNIRGRSSWAYMCASHFSRYGVGLGMGRGQKINVESENVSR